MNIKSILVVCSLTLSALPVLAYNARINSDKACKAKILKMTLPLIEAKINTSSKLTRVKYELAKNHGALDKVLHLDSAQVSGLGKYVGQDYAQQLASVAVDIKQVLAPYSLTVNLTVNDACTKIELDREVYISPVDYADRFIGND